LTSGELLLEFTYETNVNLLERSTELVWYVEDDGLTSSTAVYLLCGGDVKVSKGRTKIRGCGLKIEEFLCHRGLELIWFSLKIVRN